MNQDPFIAACRSIYEVCAAEVRSSLTGLGAEGLSWQPGASDANSAAVIAHHALGSTRDWVCIALGLPRPVRSRAEEFATAFASEDSALALVDELRDSTLSAFDTVESVDWLEVVPTVEQPGNPVTTRAYCLVHAIEHLREHTAQLSLTRQLWDARSG
ncbi:MAG: DinB family protein [Dehalococcoidia bacterium]